MVASLGNATLPAGDARRLAKAVEDQISGQAGLLDPALTAETAAWVVNVANLAKRSKGATEAVSGTVIDGVLLDEIQTEPAGCRAGAGLPTPRHRLEASLPRQKIRHEMKPK